LNGTIQEKIDNIDLALPPGTLSKVATKLNKVNEVNEDQLMQ